MNLTQKILTSTAGVALTMATVFSFAGEALALNDRPLTMLGDNGTEDTLQELFNKVTVDGPGIDAVNDQTNYDLFTSSASGGSVATFMFELAGAASSNKFGIYSSTNKDNRAEIFSGANAPGSVNGGQKLVSFLSNGNISVNGSVVASAFSDVFGFYIETATNIFYSQDILNPGEGPQALVYQGDGKTQLKLADFQAGTFMLNEFILAFEDQVYAGSDKDFNDLVVLVESVEPAPTPEPAAMAGLGIVGGLFAISRRRKASSQSC